MQDNNDKDNGRQLYTSSSSPKVMAFKWEQPISSKTVLNDKTLEQVSQFQYLGCDISYEKYHDVRNCFILFGICLQDKHF